MNFKMMGRFLALILLGEGAFMIPAAILSIGHPETFFAFLIAIGAAFVLGAALFLFGKGAPSRFTAKEGFLCVGTSWIVLSLIGSLPFFLSGEIPSFIDALFETVSGFSTTGATILTDVESLTKGTLYWRSFTHWLGGMGVLVLLLALLPASGKDQGFTLHLLRAESPGPEAGKLVPRMRKTAMILYTTYLCLTVLDFLFLIIGGMPVFDAVCTAFGTAGTGGFGIKNDSLASYSIYVKVVTAVFMFLFGINFNLFYLLTLRRFRDVFRDAEFRLYCGIIFASVVIITFDLFAATANFAAALGDAGFQVVSFMTSTGFTTANFDAWPTLSKAVLLVLMFIGASAGSTGGGFKVSRVLILWRSMKRNVRRIFRPNEVRAVRIGDTVLDENLIASTNSYFFVYTVAIFFSFLLVSVGSTQTVLSNFSAVVSCFNNIGPAFDDAAAGFASYSGFAKAVFIVDMLAGRLEIYPILALFVPAAWKRV